MSPVWGTAPELGRSSMGEERSSREECSARRAQRAGSGVEGRREGAGGKKTSQNSSLRFNHLSGGTEVCAFRTHEQGMT